MSEKPGSTEATRPAAAVAGGTAPGAPALALLAVAWLTAMLSSTHVAMSANAGTTAIFSAAYALPGVISASLVAGAGVGLLVVDLLARRGLRRPWLRSAAAVGAGALVGLVAAVTVTLGNGNDSVVAVLAGTVAAATVLGGAVAALRGPLVGAVVTAALAVCGVTFALSYFQQEITSLYGADESITSQLTALTWFSRTLSVVCGLTAGLVAYRYLSRADRRAAAGDAPHRPARWPGYLIAGAGPGAFLLAAEALIWTAGGRLLRLAGQLSEADRTAQGLLGGARVIHGLSVLFLGALVSMIAFGRTLQPAAEAAAEAATEPAAEPATAAVARRAAAPVADPVVRTGRRTPRDPDRDTAWEALSQDEQAEAPDEPDGTRERG
ncbi:hypothetical protein [Plantactinospora sp. KBS50]|uniref:hypothetical protein n=1 Tax=Plantactinospora sp. KBS50 TaxID=2024580 RepID=UPI001E558805|nr:hypothetical protein [Plantactinospora sp. KBS50]